MAFECQEVTEVSENLLNPIGSGCKTETDPDQVDPNLNIFSETVGLSTLELDCWHKKSILNSSSSKQPPGEEAISNHQRLITDLPRALIYEILNRLDPKELGIVSCVSTVLYKVASDHQVWKEFYCERWGLPVIPASTGLGYSDERSWKDLFVERESRSKTFLGRHNIEVLYGHNEAVRTVFLLACAKLIFTSGYDSVVRVWDMEEGLSIGSSRPLGCTIRAIAADTKLLAVGGTDGFIHCWRAMEGLRCLFELNSSEKPSTEFRLWNHEGPISSIALDQTRIYSGSWDMSVRIWDRSIMKCVRVLKHSDWVWDLVPHDSTIATASGTDVYVWDINTGTPVAVIRGVHAGYTYSLARSHTGDFLFTGGEDGAIRMFEIMRDGKDASLVLVANWMPHSGPVYSLAFEFPWLVSSSSDGKLALINVRKLLKTNRRPSGKRFLTVNQIDQSSVEPPQRMLHGFGCNLYSVAVGADRIVCGGEEGVVRIWNFTRALETDQRARVLRGMRLENRMRRRRLQMDMNPKGGRTDRCLAAAQKNQISVDRNRGWQSKRGMSGKLKA